MMNTTFTIEQLRQADINDYAYLVADDEGTQADEILSEDFKTQISTATWDELINESSVNSEVKTGKPGEATVEDYIEAWEGMSHYAKMTYIKHKDGSTTLFDD